MRIGLRYPIEVARACGAAGFTIADPRECAAKVEEALATPGPVVVDGIVDPNEPPLPASVTMEQATNFMKSLARGTDDRAEILKTVVKDKIRELV